MEAKQAAKHEAKREQSLPKPDEEEIGETA